MNRKGLGLKKGMGYKNLIPKYDAHRHSLNAKGYKMPQRMPNFAMKGGKIPNDKYGNQGYGLYKDSGQYNEKGWAFSMLSDVQEMVRLELPKEEIVEKINDAKRVLQGKYEEIENGFMIKIEKPQQKGGWKKSPPAKADEAEWLELFISNDYDLYQQRKVPMEKNLVKKMKKGIYNHDLAVKLFMKLVDEGARKYKKENPEEPSELNKNTRMKVAESLAESFEDEYKLGNYGD